MNTKITKRKIWSGDDKITSCNQFYISALSFTIALLVLVASPVLLQIVVPQASAAVQIVTIPYGAFDPNFNTAAPQWYLPTATTIQVNQTVTWVNQDTEGHTITSGKAGGREGLIQNNMGQPSGLFDSGTIPPGKTWSYTFTKPGQYEYFCTIHPWMDGYIIVNENQPDPTDADGKKITQVPLVRLTPDRKYEADLTWEPHYIMTGHKTTFVFQFYDNVMPHPIPAHYVFTIIQNRHQVFQSEDRTQFGGGYNYFRFDEPGPVIFRFDDIDNSGQSVEYSTIVEQMNSSSNMGNMAGMNDMVEPARNMVLQDYLLPLFFTPALITAGAVVLLVKIRKKKPQEKKYIQ
jgi:plastocyanin